MFTGIVKELGKVQECKRMGSLYRLAIESKGISKAQCVGDSISVNGVCLTVTDKKGNRLYFNVMEETVRRTNLKSLNNGDLVNIEDSLKAGEPFGGHFVLGHIDCVGKIKGLEKKGESVSTAIEIPEEFINLVVQKGAIAIEGVSLTIGEIRDDGIKVYLIPHTLEATTLGSKKVGDELNIEFDIIGKYVVKTSKPQSLKTSRISEEFLREKGFI